MEKKKQSIVGAASIIAVGKYANLIFGIIANIVLARLLNADEYGIVAILTVFVNFFQMFTDMGFGAAVIQNKDLDDQDVNNIFSLTVYLGVVLMLVFMGVSNLITLIYNNSVLNILGKLISFALLFNTWNMIPNALLLKEKRFKLVGIRTMVASGVSYGVAIVLAFLGASYYSLVFQSICIALFTFVWNYVTVKPKFGLRPKKDSIEKVFGFSMSSFGYDILNYFSRNLDNLLAGRIMGTTALGYYNKAYQLTTYPNTYFTSIISSVLHPILSDFQNQLDIIYKKYMEILKLLMAASIYVSAVFFLCSEEIVIILYGRTWEETIPCFRILSFSIFLQMVTSSITNVFRSMNRMDLRLKSGMFYVPVQVVMIVLGTLSQDITILAAFVTISFAFRYLFEFYYLIKVGFGKKMSEFFRENLPFYCVFVLCLFFSGIIGTIINIKNVIFCLIIKMFLLTVGYLLLLALFKQVYILIDLIPERIKGKFKKKYF